jgi:hypothetical protein
LRCSCARSNRTRLASEPAKRACGVLVACLAIIAFNARAADPDFSQAPGVVIDYSPASSKSYIGSPSLAVCPDGTYVASHDFFGPGSDGNRHTRVFASADRGKTWSKRADLDGQWWSTLFVHRGALYIIGVTKEYGFVAIRRSDDDGKTWTTPSDKQHGLLRDDGKFHCAPQPVVFHAGRIWRGMEDAMGPGGWGSHFRAFMLSAPEGADLLNAESWTSSNPIGRDPTWLNNSFGGWLEGNAVVTPDGHVVDILRVDQKPEGETAAMIRISDDGKTATFDPAADFIHFPGGSKKFTIRFDEQSKRYWALSNWIPPKHVNPTPAGTRNTLALISSPDLRNWDVKCVIVYHPDRTKHGFQYVDWLFDGDDMIAACRTATDDGLAGAHNFHDANFLTFHRIAHFRNLTMKDSVANFPRE